jgi:hypothetical protein
MPSDKFEKYSDLDLIEALEERNYFVVYKDDKLGHLQDEELEEELFNRKGKWLVDKDDYEQMKTLLQNQGYNVNERDQRKELLEELYYQAICGPGEAFIRYMNELFKKDLERWL